MVNSQLVQKESKLKTIAVDLLFDLIAGIAFGVSVNVFTAPNHIAPGVKRFALTELTDVVPTLLCLCGAEPEPQMQGKSFAHLLEKNAEDKHRKYVYSEYYNSNINHRDPKAYLTMIYNGRYKLIRVHDTPCTVGGELYDLKKDPNETYNLYDDPEYINVKCGLLENMADAMAATADPMPERRASW